MRYALKRGKKILPNPKVKDALCPCCGSRVIPKCGEVYRWHWAHVSESDCPYKPMTEWHLEWQSNFHESITEVITKDSKGEKHIADVLNHNGVTIEFQHSQISKSEVESRFNQYDKLIWVLDGDNYKFNATYKRRFSYKKNIHTAKALDFTQDFNQLIADKLDISLSDLQDIINNTKKVANKDSDFWKDLYFDEVYVGSVSKSIEKFNNKGSLFIDKRDNFLYYDVTPNKVWLPYFKYIDTSLRFKSYSDHHNFDLNSKLKNYVELSTLPKISNLIEDFNVRFNDTRIFKRISKQYFLNKYSTSPQKELF